MTDEQFPISIVTQLTEKGSLIAPGTYYRSKLFIAPFSNNSLVSAAGPIFSLLERLCISPSLPPIQNIRDNIEHELQAFLCKLHATKYAFELIGISHYLLCATIDELIGKNYLRIFNTPLSFSSFTPVSEDNKEPQTYFFDIVHFIKERPNQYLDLIEFVYFCLIIGFEGKYHLKADGRQVLDNTNEDLYQIIQQYRFNKPAKLLNENPLPKIEKKSYKSTILSAAAAVGVLIIAFYTSQMLLENKAKSVLSEHTQLAMLED